MTPQLKVFISSPSDVSAERRRAALVIEKHAKEYGRFFDVMPVLWETEPMLASGHFQDAICAAGTNGRRGDGTPATTPRSW